MERRLYYQSETRLEFGRERTLLERAMRLVLRVAEEFISLVDYAFRLVQLGELQLGTKMAILFVAVGFPCFLLCIMMAVGETGEEEEVAKKEQ